MEHNKFYLIEILDLMLENDIEFIICGGLASIYHGVERMTMDIDISLNFGKQNVKKFLSIMKKLQMVPRVPEPPESLLDKDRIDFFIKEKNALVFTFINIDLPFKQVDVFLTHNNSYEVLINDSIEINILNKKAKILTMEKLINMKENITPLREKDKFDIIELKKRLR